MERILIKQHYGIDSFSNKNIKQRYDLDSFSNKKLKTNVGPKSLKTNIELLMPHVDAKLLNFSHFTQLIFDLDVELLMPMSSC